MLNVFFYLLLSTSRCGVGDQLASLGEGVFEKHSDSVSFVEKLTAVSCMGISNLPYLHTKNVFGLVKGITDNSNTIRKQLYLQPSFYLAV